MERILEKLLVNDSKIVQEGTSELKKAFVDPSSIQTLCDILVTNQRADIRHITVVLLRRKFSKRRLWIKLPPDTRTIIKQGMLSALVNEADKSVKTGIAQMLGQIGKFEIADDSWPELLQFIFTLCDSDNTTDKELGMYTLSITTEMSHGSYIKHFTLLAALFSKILNTTGDFSSNLAYYTLKTMKNLVPTIGAHQQMITVYHDLLPRLMEIMNALSRVDEHKGTEALGLLEELVDFAVPAVVPHVRNVVEMCLRIACDRSIPSATQVKAISIIGWLVRSKGKVLMKHQLITPIIDVLMELMARVTEVEEDEEYFAGDSDQLTPVTVATQTLDLIALNIPADKVVHYILQKIEPHIQGTDPNNKKAAFLCLAVLAEGCSECIRKKYLEAFINCVCEAIKHNSSLVKNAAFFALGQFSEHLQPEVSKYSEKLMPLLFEFLNNAYDEMAREKTEPNCLDRLFYAIGTFCNNLDEGLLPYLPMLMERLFQGLNPDGWSVELKKCCYNTLEAAITAVKAGILPYFQKILEIVNLFLNSAPGSDNYELRSYAIDCLAVLADGVGPEHFKPLAEESLQMALKLIVTHDPDLRRAVMALFGSLSSIMKEDIIGSLPVIVKELIMTLQNSDGIVTYYDDDEEGKNDCDIFGQSSESEENSDEEDLDSNDSEDLGNNCHYSVENPFSEEKEQACMTMKEICAQTNRGFVPYIDRCYDEVFKLLGYPRDHIRKAAIETILQFCISLHKINNQSQDLYLMLARFIPKCSEIVRTDEEKGVVIVALDAFSTLLKELKHDVFIGNGHREAIMNSVIDVLAQKTVCQDNDLSVVASYENFEETTDAEQDEILLESACDIIPKYGFVLNAEDFATYFTNLLPIISARTTKHQSIAQRSFSFGTLAECMPSLDIHVRRFVPKLVDLWLAGLKDSADEVRNNAAFGLGEMILYGKEHIFEFYPAIFRTLSAVVNKETHAGALDNICGTIAKVIIVNSSAIPLDQVFPVYLHHLPLKTDFEENKAVIKAFLVLYEKGSSVLYMHIEKVSKILVHIYVRNEYPNEDSKMTLITLLRSIYNTFSVQFNGVLRELDEESIAILHQLFV